MTITIDPSIVRGMDDGLAYRNNGLAVQVPGSRLDQIAESGNANDNAVIHIDDIRITPKAFAKGEVHPACLIASLVAAARVEIVLLCKCLHPDVYHEPAVIEAFCQAVDNGVQIWILVDDKKDRSWMVDDALLKCILPYENEMVFVRTLSTELTEDCNVLTVGIKDNYLVVDGKYIRYERDPNVPNAFGFRHEDAANHLRAGFRLLWSEEACDLMGAPDPTLTFSARTAPVGRYTRHFFQCDQHPGIAIDYNTDNREEAINSLISASSTAMTIQYGRIGTAYRLDDRDMTNGGVRLRRHAEGTLLDNGPPETFTPRG